MFVWVIVVLKEVVGFQVQFYRNFLEHAIIALLPLSLLNDTMIKIV